MEKAVSLVGLDRELCNYHLKNNYSKKDNLYCYQPDRAQIAHFYSSMADHFYHNKLKEQPRSPRPPRHLKARSHTLQAIRDPTLACLPSSIPQQNLIDPGTSSPAFNQVPMFSEVEASKKQKYLIAKEIRQMLGHDIKQMQKEKEETAFRKRFPDRQPRPPSLPQEQQTELLIREYNRLLIKYKNNALNVETPLALLQKENNPSFPTDSTADQQFRILNLFKKLYLETKSADINQQLINYLLKFHLSDKLTKKLNTKTTPAHPNHQRAPSPNPLPQRMTRTTSQMSIRSSNIKDSKQQSNKSSHFKAKNSQPIKKRTFDKGNQRIRSSATEQLKLKI